MDLLDILSIFLSVLAISMSFYWRYSDTHKHNEEVRYDVKYLKSKIPNSNSRPTYPDHLNFDLETTKWFNEQVFPYISSANSKEKDLWLSLAETYLMLEESEMDEDALIELQFFLMYYNMLSGDSKIFTKPFIEGTDNVKLILPLTYFNFKTNNDDVIRNNIMSTNLNSGMYFDGGTKRNYTEMIRIMEHIEIATKFDKKLEMEFVDPSKLKNILMHPTLNANVFGVSGTNPKSQFGLAVIPSIKFIRLFTPTKWFCFFPTDKEPNGWTKKNLRAYVACFGNFGISKQIFMLFNILFTETVLIDTCRGVIKKVTEFEFGPTAAAVEFRNKKINSSGSSEEEIKFEPLTQFDVTKDMKIEFDEEKNMILSYKGKKKIICFPQAPVYYKKRQLYKGNEISFNQASNQFEFV